MTAHHFFRGDHVEIAQHLVLVLRSRAPLGPVIAAEGSVWAYQGGGVFCEVSPAELSRDVQAFAGSPCGNPDDPRALKIKSTDVAGAVKLARDSIDSPGFFADARPGLAFADCFVEITAEGVTPKPHAPENRARSAYLFAYPENVASVPWLGFLDSLFRDDADRVEKIALLQEHAGACLAGIAPRFQRAIVGVGRGGEGKSTYGEILSHAMPHGTVSAIPPQEWGNEYRRAMLRGKLLNIVAELPDRDLLASEAFKAIVTGDAIVGREIREAPFMYRPRCGHLFMANELPGTSDQSEGFWRRLVVARFNRSFKDDPARDPGIAERLIASELPRIVAWALQGAVRLLRQGAYTIPASHFDELAAWRAAADPVVAFLADRYPGRRGVTPAGVVYGAFVAWADANGHREMSSTKFGRRMAALGLGASNSGGRSYPVDSGLVGMIGGGA